MRQSWSNELSFRFRPEKKNKSKETRVFGKSSSGNALEKYVHSLKVAGHGVEA